MDETARAMPGSLSSKSRMMSGPDKQRGSPRMSLSPSNTSPTGKKRLSMAEGTGPPPTNVAPYLAGPAVAAFCGQRASQKADLLQYLGKHKGAAARLLASSTVNTETDAAINNSSSCSGSIYPGADSKPDLTSTNRSSYRPSAFGTNSVNSDITYTARASSMLQELRSSSPDRTSTQHSATRSESTSPSQQRRLSVTAYLQGQQDLVTTVLEGVPYVDCNSDAGPPFDDIQQLYQQQQQWQGDLGLTNLQRPDSGGIMTPAAATAAGGGGGCDRHSVVRDVIHHRITEAVARRSSSPAAAAAPGSSSPTRMHDEVSGVRHLLIDEGRARRASCNTLTYNSNNNLNVTRQIFGISTDKSSSSSSKAAAAAMAKCISNAAIYPAAYEGLLHGQSDNHVTDSYNSSHDNPGSYAVYDPAVQGNSERVSVGDYSYGQRSTTRCSTMAATAFMHMYDAQSDQQQQQQLCSDDQIEYGHPSMTAAAAAAERAAALDAAEESDDDKNDSSSDESEGNQLQQQQQQGAQRARIPKPRTRYNRGWSVASAAAARRRSSITPAAASAGPSARTAAAVAARRTSKMQAGSSSSSRRSSDSSDGATDLNDLAATGRASITQGLVPRSSDSSSSSNDEPSSQSVARLVNRARRSSAAGGLTARQQVRQRLLLRLKNRRSSSSERRSSSDDQGGFLARSGGSESRSAAAGNPRASAAAAGSSARRSGRISNSSRRATMAFVTASRGCVKPRGSITNDSDCTEFNISDAAAARMKRNSKVTIVNQSNQSFNTGRLSIAQSTSMSRTVPLKFKRNSSNNRRRVSSERRSSSDGPATWGNNGGSSSSGRVAARRLSDAIEVLLNPDDKLAHRLSLGPGAAAAIVMGRDSGAAPGSSSSSSRGARVRQSYKTAAAAAAVGVPIGPKRFSVVRRISSIKQQQQQIRESVRDLGGNNGAAASRTSAAGSSVSRRKSGSDSNTAAAAGSQAQEDAKWVAGISRRLSGVALHS